MIPSLLRRRREQDEVMRAFEQETIEIHTWLMLYSPTYEQAGELERAYLRDELRMRRSSRVT